MSRSVEYSRRRSVASLASKESGITRAEGIIDILHVLSFFMCSQGEHDLSFRPRKFTFQHEMSLSSTLERQDRTHMRSQRTSIDKVRDLL